MLKVWLTCVNHFGVLQNLCTFALAEDNGQRRGTTRERRQRLKGTKGKRHVGKPHMPLLFFTLHNRHSREDVQMSPLF